MCTKLSIQYAPTRINKHRKGGELIISAYNRSVNFVLRTKKKNLVALRPVQRPFSAKTVCLRTNTPNFFLTPKSNEQILYAAVNLVLNTYKTISPEPCSFRKLFYLSRLAKDLVASRPSPYAASPDVIVVGAVGASG